MTYKIFSLGCKVNSYECAAISSMFQKAGYVENSDSPDVVLINTCSVTATADQKSRQHIRKFQNLYPNSIIVVMGCYAQGNKDFIANEIKPTILVGTSNRNKIVELIEQYQKTKTPIVMVDPDPRKYTYEELGVTSCSENTRAYLKIQDGCNNFCTYCIVPFRRGKMRSRNKDAILEEARNIVNSGYQEIVLSGIHVGGYGQDLEDINFSKLVSLLSDIQGLNSLRISSIEESEIDDDLIALISSRNNIAHHLHIPLQSGSNEVLKAMNRKYTREEFIDKVQRIKKAIPDIAVSTDIIVGFPGETEENFLDTVDLAEKCFDMIHVFPYSPREGTVAAVMKNQIDPRIKTERVNRLLDLSKKLWESYTNRFVNSNVNVLIERYDTKSKLNIGHTSNYLEVAIQGDTSKVGQYVNILLTKNMIVSK